MNDMSNQGQFRTFPVDSASDFPAATPPAPPVSAPRPASYVGNTAIHSENAAQPIGVVLEIAGSSSHIALDLERLNECAADPDPSIALAGQVGSQIKIRVGEGWLLASVRTQKKDGRNNIGIIAGIDFLGEGEEEKLTGRIHSFRRGVTRYPIPGSLIYPATNADLRQIYASDGRSSIQIGTVFPPRIFARASISTRCSASTSPCWVRPARASRPRRR